MSAKGYYYWDVNSYGQLGPEMVAKLKDVDNSLRQEFPRNVTEQK